MEHLCNPLVHFVKPITPQTKARNHTFSQPEERVLCMTNVAAQYRRVGGSGLRFATANYPLISTEGPIPSAHFPIDGIF